MGKKTKIWLTTASILVVIGLIVFATIMTMNKWDFNKLSTYKFEINTYEISEDFEEVVIDVDTSDVKIIPAQDNICKVVCKESEKFLNSIKVENNKLMITSNDQRKWYDKIGVNNGSYIIIYLPNTKSLSYNFDLASGDIYMENLSLNVLEIEITTGDIELNNIKCDSFSAKGSTGSVELTNVIVNNNVYIKRTTGDIDFYNASCSKLDIEIGTGDTELTNVLVINDFNLNGTTGDVELEEFDASNIYITLTTGDVLVNLLSSKIVQANSRTGKIEYPDIDLEASGVCKIKTTTGDIEVEFK